MANRGQGFGDSGQRANKIASKRDPDLEAEILEWIATILGKPLPSGAYEDILKDGVILCTLIEKLLPGSISKINTTGSQFKLMENINRFQEACKKYGVPEVDVFQTVDLWERRNIPQVTICILALGRQGYLHPEFKGPYLGKPPAQENIREFTEEQIRDGQTHIGLQMGQNKGATQSGQSFGNSRHM